MVDDDEGGNGKTKDEHNRSYQPLQALWRHQKWQQPRVRQGSQQVSWGRQHDTQGPVVRASSGDQIAEHQKDFIEEGEYHRLVSTHKSTVPLASSDWQAWSIRQWGIKQMDKDQISTVKR